jgi:Pyruvate/2-oxoacid:ferredoxin oxidoreductase gamma subunit
MRQIYVYGRGGQGVRLACRVLAAAFVRAGSRAWAIGGYGDDCPGTPATALVQVDDHVFACDDVVLLDPALLGEPFVATRVNGVVFVAAAAAPCSRARGAADVVAVDAAPIAAACGLGADVGTTMAGAFAATTELLALDTVEAGIIDSRVAHAGAHLAACRAGYRAAARAHAYRAAS